MNVGHIFRCIICVLLLTCMAQAGVVTVKQVMDYDDSGSYTEEPFFMDPNDIEDHPPHFRGVLESWGWTHDVSAIIPEGATGVKSATLAIEAWDVSRTTYVELEELDMISVNGIDLGYLLDTNGRHYGWTLYSLPADLLEDLWVDAAIYVYIDIDELNAGNRVALRQSELTIEFLTDGEIPEPDPIVEVHRFWSGKSKSHFYTSDVAERNKLIYNQSDVWTHEGIAYLALVDNSDPTATPVYRFWSDVSKGHFYTIYESERDKLIDSPRWTYEEIAFYAYAEDSAPAEAVPVYRFWSDKSQHHFYTIYEDEKQKLIDQFEGVWTYEGVAWYAYPAQ